MPRPSRLDVPGLPQHLVARGHNRTNCFHREFDRTVYLKYLRETLARTQCDLHAYVLMTNHVHLLVTGRHEGALSRLMQQVGRRYCRYVNRTYTRSGAIYERRFQSSLVESEAYFVACMRYIEMNPVRAGMVDHPSRYPWSSYAENANGDPKGFLVPHRTYLDLGSAPATRGAAYRAFVGNRLEAAELDRIRYAIRRNDVLGGASFISALESELGRKVVARAIGRPRKK